MRVKSNVNELETITVNLQREMAVYDALPPPIRTALRESSVNRAASPLGENIVGGIPPAYVLDLLRAEESSRQSAYRKRVGL